MNRLDLHSYSTTLSVKTRTCVLLIFPAGEEEEHNRNPWYFSLCNIVMGLFDVLHTRQKVSIYPKKSQLSENLLILQSMLVILHT